MVLGRNVALAVAGALAVSGTALASVSTAQAASDAACSTPVLDRPQRAQDVARTDPGAFRAAQVRNARSVPDLAQRVRNDRSLWLDRCATAYYVDAAASPAERTAARTSMGASAAAATAEVPLDPAPLADTFTLESRPGSARTIYLDFTGDTLTGTAWNRSYGDPLPFEPFSIDSTVDTNFSDAELTEIQKVWQAVAEDYAPFDVNVTTRDLGPAAIGRSTSSDLVYGTRALITNGGTVYDACGCGGVAYVNVFNSTGSTHDYYQPALVFSDGTTKNGKYIGEATSHEVGHNFGLNHDGTSSTGYYTGSAPWAPIMGASYSQPVSQWSKGDYPGANNTQDDLVQIAGGAPFRADEDTTGALPLGNGSAASGIITRSTDVDSYAFSAAGATTVSVANAAGFPNLDVQLRIVDANGVEVALVNPTTTRISAFEASGMNATASFTAPSSGAGYTAHVQGAGQGTLGTAGAYPSYGSLGHYQVSLTTQLPSDPTPLAVSVGPMPNGTVGAAYSASPVTTTGGVAPYTYSATGLPGGLGINPGTGAVTGTPTAAGTFAPVFTVTDSAGGSASRGGSVTVVAATSPLAFVTSSTLPNAKLRRAYSAKISVTGGSTPYTWARTSGTLPAGLGLSFSGSTATLAGTPTKATKTSFTLRVTDAKGVAVSRTFTIRVTK